MALTQSIKNFFAAPDIKPPSLFGDFSVLYLLRRDIHICFGVHPDEKRKLDDRALWPGVMGVLAGIDLLGKYFAGNDSIGGSRDRFKEFIRNNFENISRNDEAVIYQLRNSLLHSFGLYSRNGAGKEYKFILKARNEKMIESLSEDQYCVDIISLWNSFEKSIESYFKKIEASIDLQQKFESMLPNYGWVTMVGSQNIETNSPSTSGFGKI